MGKKTKAHNRWTCASHATAPSFSGYPGLRPWLIRLEATLRSPTHPLDWCGQTRSWPARPWSSCNWIPRAVPWWMAGSRESGRLYTQRVEGHRARDTMMMMMTTSFWD